MTFTALLVDGSRTIPWLLAAMVVLALVELAIPRRRASPGSARVRANLGLTAIALVTNLVLNAALVLALAHLHRLGIGLAPILGLSALATIAVAVIGLDLATWVAHVAMHRSAWLWRVHRVHHSDTHIDVTTTIRQHPGESLFRYACIATAAIVLGAGPAAFAVYRTGSVFWALLEHANVRLPARVDRLVSLVLTTPSTHEVHHSRAQPQTDSNYANIFAAFDRLFATFNPPPRDLVVGLDGHDGNATARQLLALPFAGERRERAR